MIGYIDKLAALIGDKPGPRSVPASLFTPAEQHGIYGSRNIPFDLLIDESHSIDFDITDHAVENGASITDHIVQRPRSVQVTGLFTNHPIGNTQWTDDNGNFESDEVEIDGLQPLSNYALTKFEMLEDFVKTRQKVRLVTSLFVYDEMYIESLSASRGPQDGESIKFTLKLREIRKAEVKTQKTGGTWIPKTQDSAEAQNMSDVQNNGTQSGQEKDSAQKLADLNKGGEV